MFVYLYLCVCICVFVYLYFPPAASRIGGAHWRKVTKVFYPTATPLYHSKKIIPSSLFKSEVKLFNSRNIVGKYFGKVKKTCGGEVIGVGRLYPLIPLI